jgi:hypothetical protein
MPHTPEAFRRETYREIVSAEAKGKLWPHSSNTGVAIPIQTSAGIPGATTVERTDEPVPNPAETDVFDWKPGRSQPSAFQLENAGVSSDDFADWMSTVLREQALAHGIDVT